MGLHIMLYIGLIMVYYCIGLLYTVIGTRAWRMRKWGLYSELQSSSRYHVAIHGTTHSCCWSTSTSLRLEL